jgi:hypothetical protein
VSIDLPLKATIATRALIPRENNSTQSHEIIFRKFSAAFHFLMGHFDVACSCSKGGRRKTDSPIDQKNKSLHRSDNAGVFDILRRDSSTSTASLSTSTTTASKRITFRQNRFCFAA